MKRLVYIFAASLVLVACSSSDQSNQQEAAKAPPAGTVVVPKNNVFSPLVNDLNKAKQVNNQVQQQFQKANGEVESATSTNAPAAATSGP